jgi:hypothetical protein
VETKDKENNIEKLTQIFEPIWISKNKKKHGTIKQ